MNLQLCYTVEPNPCGVIEKEKPMFEYEQAGLKLAGNTARNNTEQDKKHFLSPPVSLSNDKELNILLPGVSFALRRDVTVILNYNFLARTEVKT